MKMLDVPTDDPVKMVRAIREQIYEETKNMTPEERREYTRRKSEVFRRSMQNVNLDDFDFSFLDKHD